MQITEVKVFPVDEEKLKAFVSIVFDGCFMINDIKVIHGKDGLFISMPSRKKKNGQFKDVAHPLNNETRQRIEARVLDEYERVLEAGGRAPEVDRRELGTAGAVPPPATIEIPQVPGGKIEPLAVASAGPGQEERAAPEAVAASGGEDPTDQRGEPAVEKLEPAVAAVDEEGERSLEEIQEMHLRDSFWSVS